MLELFMFQSVLSAYRHYCVFNSGSTIYHMLTWTSRSTTWTRQTKPPFSPDISERVGDSSYNDCQIHPPFKLLSFSNSNFHGQAA